MAAGLAIEAAVISGACSNPPPAAPKKEDAATPAAVKITQFYAASPRIGKGDRTELCYGVEGASAVELTPRVDEVWPSYSRCVDAKPGTTTIYTLTARDAAGHSVSKSATIEVGPAVAKQSTARIIQEVTVNKLQVAAGEQVTICYTAKNATSVKITPGESTQQSSDKGCVTDRPAQTTTYQVAATGAGGATDSERGPGRVRCAALPGTGDAIAVRIGPGFDDAIGQDADHYRRRAAGPP